MKRIQLSLFIIYMLGAIACISVQQCASKKPLKAKQSAYHDNN